jgi:Smg protein
MHVERISKSNMLGVLMYLFKKHMQNNCKLDRSPQNLTAELQQKGFRKDAINKAFNWLAELNVSQYNIKYNSPQKNSIRIYSNDECKKINKICRNFIISLEHSGILNTATRELVISQVMHLDQKEISLNQIKWVALMVLFNQSDQRDALNTLTCMVLNDNIETMH